MKILLLILLFIYILICLALYIFQRKLLYHPPSNVFVFDEKQIVYEKDNIKLHGWIINEGNENALIYYGGNAESIELNIKFFKEVLPKYTVYLINYRGYGKSQGEISEKALFDDALYIYDEIKQNHKNISLMGRSLGSGVASYVASKKQVKKLVLVTPYDSIENVAKNIYKLFPVGLLLKDKFESWKYAKDIKAETLIIYSSNDMVVSPLNTKNLINSFDKNNLETIEINDANHNNIEVFNEYLNGVRNFLN